MHPYGYGLIHRHIKYISTCMGAYVRVLIILSYYNIYQYSYGCIRMGTGRNTDYPFFIFFTDAGQKTQTSSA